MMKSIEPEISLLASEVHVRKQSATFGKPSREKKIVFLWMTALSSASRLSCEHRPSMCIIMNTIEEIVTYLR